ncbi:MAG: DNA-binding protein [Alphaproteobacteria bacterium]|nr:DNA-binding protein [Alphaproteobacteria bacterium]
MALFFDQEWFDIRLSERGLNKMALGAVLGLGIEEIDAMWKDQREISPREVTLLAELLGATTREISERGGAATPLPKAADDTGAVLARLDARLQKLERGQADILALLVSLSEKMPGD